MRHRSAMALLVVLVLVMMAALSAYGYTFYMESQYRSSKVYEEQVHARQAVLNASEMLAAILELPLSQRVAVGTLENNPTLFRDKVMESQFSSRLTDDNNSYWRASVLAPQLSEDRSTSPWSATGLEQQRGYAFGLENESAKIPLKDLLLWNLRVPGHAKQVLLGLPGATESLVDAYLSELNAQLAMGNSNSMPNAIRNNMRTSSRAIGSSSPNPSDASVFNSSESLLLQEQLRLLWLGGDLNQNYRIDALDSAWASNQTNSRAAISGRSSPPGEGAAFNAAQPSLANRQLSVAGQAWSRYLTWYSGSRNESYSGLPRVDLNQPDLRSLRQQLLKIWPAEWADFVVLFRQYGAVPALDSGGQAGQETAISAAGIVDLAVPASRMILSPLELVGAVVPLPSPSGSTSNKSSKRRVSSPFKTEVSQMSNYLYRLLDEVTAESAPNGRIDVNGASLPVIMAIPGMDRQLAEAIIQRREGRSRQSAGGAVDTTIAWLLQDGVIDLRRLVVLEPYMTGRSDVYSCQIVGYRDDQSAVYRCTLTIDARQRPAIKRNIQTWHSWDRGFSTTELAINR